MSANQPLPQGPVWGMRPKPERAYVTRLVVTSALVATGVVLVLLAFLAFNFHHRFDGYVEVDGTVQELPDAETRAEIGFDVVLVAYEIAGSSHVGVLFGSYTEGTTLRIAAPPSGSTYEVLRLPDSAGVVVMGWLSMIGGIAAVGIGLFLVVRTLKARDRALREQVAAEVALLPPSPWSLPPPSPQPPPELEGPGLSKPAQYGL